MNGTQQMPESITDWLENHARIEEAAGCPEEAARCREAAAEIVALRRIIPDLHWMSRRYADNRKTYAAGLHNGLTRELLALGVELIPGNEGLWARDGMGDGFAEITAEESATVKSAIEAERNDREDAERYRELRNNDHTATYCEYITEVINGRCGKNRLDAAIDSARGAT